MFSWLVGLGASLGLAWVAVSAPRKQALARVDAGLWCLAGALVGARAAYAAANWPYYRAHPLEIVQLWNGGLAWPGALAGGLLVVGILAWARRISPGSLADGLLPLLPPLIVAIWLGSWQSGVGYGRLEPSCAFPAVPARDEWGLSGCHWPLQPAGALATIIVFAVLDVLRARLARPGQAFCIAWLALSALLLGASLLRADPYPLWNGLRLETWAALASGGLAILSGLYTFIRPAPAALPAPARRYS